MCDGWCKCRASGTRTRPPRRRASTRSKTSSPTSSSRSLTSRSTRRAIQSCTAFCNRWSDSTVRGTRRTGTTWLTAAAANAGVDDESKPEHRFAKRFPPPAEWVSAKNPPYSYWAFYLQQNLRSLNELRQERGMSTFAYRPHWCVVVRCARARTRATHAPATQRRSRRSRALADCVFGRQRHQPRHRAAQSAVARVPLLHRADWHGALAALEQRALHRLPQKSVLQVLSARPQRLAVDRRPAAVSLHARAAHRRIQHCGASVEALDCRSNGNCTQ